MLIAAAKDSWASFFFSFFEEYQKHYIHASPFANQKNACLFTIVFT